MPGEKDTVAQLNRLKGDGMRARQPFEQDWWLNSAFYLGYQYTRWGRRGALEEVPRPEGERNSPRPVANKIMHFAMQSHAAAMSHDPRPEVLPHSSDAADLSNARVTQAYLDDLTSANKMDWASVRSEALLWAIIPGTSWIKWYYNAEKKRPDAMALSPFDVIVDPYVKKASDARYIVHTQFLDAEQVYDKYGIETSPEGSERVDKLRADILIAMGYAPSLSGVTVNELWEKPSRRRPQGRYAVWTGSGKLLVPPQELPYRHLLLPQSGGLPFSQLGMVPIPGVPYYHSATKFLRPGQMELNKYHAQVLVTMRNFASPKWFVDSTLQLEHMPDDSPNQVLVGDSQGGALLPVILQPAAMADTGAGKWIVEEMEDTVGLHAVSQGDAPGRVDSARALELLRNEDLSRLAVLNATLDSAIADGFWQLLMLTKQFVPTRIVATTYTRDGIPEVKQFMGSSISDDYSVRVLSAAGMPRTQAARNEWLLSLWNAQIITDARRMTELLDLPYSGNASDSEQSLRQATNENILLTQEVPVSANEWDDHELHVREHNNCRRTSDFAAATDKVRSIMEFHIQTHENMILAETDKVAQQQARVQEIAANAAPPVDAPPVPAVTPPADANAPAEAPTVPDQEGAPTA